MSVSTLTGQFRSAHAYPLAWHERDLMQRVMHAIAARYLEDGYRVVYLSSYTDRITTRRLLAGSDTALPLSVRTSLEGCEFGAAMTQLVGSIFGNEPLVVIIEDIMAMATRTNVAPSARYMDSLCHLARKHGAIIVGGMRAGRQVGEDAWQELSDVELCECLGRGHQPWFISQEGRKTKVCNTQVPRLLYARNRGTCDG